MENQQQNQNIEGLTEEVKVVSPELVEQKANLEKIEANKNKLNLKPNIDFVSSNISIFEKGLSQIMQRVPDSEAEKWIESVQFNGVDDIVAPQVLPEDCKIILARMPKSLIELSKLEKIDYHTFGNIKVIPVPGFDEEGNFNPGKVRLVSVDEFPREIDHPSRVLVGVSNGETIFPTPIPHTVSEDQKAVYLYQVHVLLHEFFHTIESKRRENKIRKEIVFETDGSSFTFEDFWQEFENILISGDEPKAISMYGNTYLETLTPEMKENDYKKFTYAVAEQICETFVAYQLGIISNKEGWTDFRSESFGNVKKLMKFISQESESANMKWALMDKLCRAKVIKKA